MDRRIDRTARVDRNDAVVTALVEQPHRVGIADRAVAEPDRDRVAVVQHVDIEQAAGRQRIDHDATDRRDDRAVGDGASPDDAVDRRLAFLAALDVDVVVVADQPLRPADLGHHVVAGVDAEPALDAFELRSIADVDAGRTHGDALITVDAVADLLAERAQLGRLLDRGTLLAAIVTIGHVERPFVGERGLDPRPRTHIGADLHAHEAGEHVSRRGENADPDIGDYRRLEGDELPDQRRCFIEIEHPGTPGPRPYQKPDLMIKHYLGDALHLHRVGDFSLLHPLA